MTRPDGRNVGLLVLAQIEDDAYQEDLGFSLGQLGKSGSGRVRQAQVNDATKARISKSLQVGAEAPPPPPTPPVSPTAVVSEG